MSDERVELTALSREERARCAACGTEWLPASLACPVCPLPILSPDDITAVAGMLEAKRADALAAKHGVSLTWDDARDYALTLRAAAHSLQEARSRIVELEQDVEQRHRAYCELFDSVRSTPDTASSHTSPAPSQEERR